MHYYIFLMLHLIMGVGSVAVRVIGTTEPEVNGLYLCRSIVDGGSCPHAWLEGLVLRQVFRMVGGVKQRRWYIHNESVTAPLYGAIAPDDDAPFTTQPWRKLGVNATTIPLMRLEPTPSQCDPAAGAVVNSFVAWTLLLDPSTSRGRYSAPPDATTFDGCVAALLPAPDFNSQLSATTNLENRFRSISRSRFTSPVIGWPLELMVLCQMMASTDDCFSAYALAADQEFDSYNNNNTGGFELCVGAAPLSPLACYSHNVNDQLGMDRCCMLLSGAVMHAEFLLVVNPQPQRVLELLARTARWRRAFILLEKDEKGETAIPIQSAESTAAAVIRDPMNGLSVLALAMLGIGLQDLLHISTQFLPLSPRLSQQLIQTLVHPQKKQLRFMVDAALKVCRRLQTLADLHSHLMTFSSLLFHACHYAHTQEDDKRNHVNVVGVPPPLESCRALAQNLMTLGNDESAAWLVARLIIRNMPLPPSLPEAATKKASYLLSWSSTNDPNFSPLDRLSYIAHQLPLLSSVARRRWAASPELSLLLGILLQVGSPVVSCCGNACSSTRPLLLSALDAIHQICGESCTLPDLEFSVRGLFLLAYQDLPPLAASFFSQVSAAAVPRRFLSIVQSSRPDWPWLFKGKDPVLAEAAAAAAVAAVGSAVVVDSMATRQLVRVGFASSYFYRHPVGRLLAPIIIHLAAAAAADRASSSKPGTPQRRMLEVHVIVLGQGPSQKQAPRDDDLTLHLVNILGSKHLHRPAACSVSGGSAVACVLALRQLSLDVLVFGDCHMDALTAFTSMMRVAPVTVAFWGHPSTTGWEDAVDYFVTSSSFEGALEGQGQGRPRAVHREARRNDFSEQLVAFESLSTAIYWPHLAHNNSTSYEYDGDVSLSAHGEFMLRRLMKSHGSCRTLAGLPPRLPVSHYEVKDPNNDDYKQDRGNDQEEDLKPRGPRFYGCLQSLFKMHPSLDLALAALLRADTEAVVLVLLPEREQPVWASRFIERLRRVLATNGAQGSSVVTDFNLASRVWIVAPLPTADYEAVVCSLHVTLDPFPFGGGLTLVDGLSCPEPVPFVTVSALQSVHRLGAGFVAALAREGLQHDHIGGWDDNETRPCSFPLGLDGSLSPTPLSFNPTPVNDTTPFLIAQVENFAAIAIGLAKRSQACRLYLADVTPIDGGSPRSNQVRRALFDPTSAAEEWRAFLLRAV